jgi:hypothetical protein
MVNINFNEREVATWTSIPTTPLTIHKYEALGIIISSIKVSWCQGYSFASLNLILWLLFHTIGSLSQLIIMNTRRHVNWDTSNSYKILMHSNDSSKYET